MPVLELRTGLANSGDHGAAGYLANGRTVYCTQVARTCTDVCRLPDGSFVPNYQRCGVLCGEPPTSGDIQSGLYDCFNSGAPYQDCVAAMPR